MPSESLPWLANMLQVFPGCHREDALFSRPHPDKGLIVRGATLADMRMEEAPYGLALITNEFVVHVRITAPKERR